MFYDTVNIAGKINKMNLPASCFVLSRLAIFISIFSSEIFKHLIHTKIPVRTKKYLLRLDEASMMIDEAVSVDAAGVGEEER
jgi:hypothetical protein